MKNKRFVAVVPVYNESKYICKTVNNLKSISCIDEIVVIDDGSTDNTYSIIKNLSVKVIRLSKNKGKGNAIKEGIKGLDFDYIVLLDGDLGESVIEINKLIHSVVSNDSDVCIAKFPKSKTKGGFGLVKKFSKMAVFLHTGEKMDCIICGQRIYKRKVIEKMKYIPNRFGVELAMTVEAIRNDFKISIVNVDMKHRETGRNLKGFIHRGRQFFDIFKTFIFLYTIR